jgi:uncharacterized protein (DUF885 family)
MRMVMMLALGIGGGLFVIPLIAVARSNEDASSAQSEAAREFRAYLNEDWKRWMTEYPEMATEVGFPGQNRRWSDDSAEGIEQRRKHLRESLAALKKIPRDALPAEEKLNYDLYRELLETGEEGLQYGDDPLPFRNVVPGNVWMPVTQMGGIQQGAAAILADMPRRTVADYEDILARLEGLPKSVEQQVVLLQEGLKRG